MTPRPPVLPVGPRKKLYGRESQLKMLIETFHKVVPELESDPAEPTATNNAAGSLLSHFHRPLLTLITGPSGTGKTALATALADHVLKNQSSGMSSVYFVSGKFDQFVKLENLGTCYPINQALDSYFKQLVIREPAYVVDQLASELLRRLSADFLLLMNSIPALYSILLNASRGQNGDESLTEVSTLGWLNGSDVGLMDQARSRNLAATDGDERVRFVIRSILQIICSPEKPVILLIDDWQWADDASLELIKEVIQDVCIQGLMLLGACRGNEVDIKDNLAVMLRELEDESICDIVDVQVSNLSLTEVEALVSEALVVPNPKLFPSFPYGEVAAFVHRLTGGNPFGTQQMVEFLGMELSTLEDPSLMKNPEDYIKQLIADKMQGMHCDFTSVDILVSLVLLRIADLPEDIQEVLKTGACLGRDFDSNIVAAALNLKRDEMEAAFDKAQKLELFGVLSDRPDHFHFVHDKIQEASYTMIPENSKGSMHVSIGRNIKDAMDRGDLVFDARLLVDQFRRCLSFFDSESRRVSLAELCLQAARSSHHAVSIAASREYFELGLSLLPERHWRDHYKLSFELTCAAAEMFYALGQHEKTAALVNDVETSSASKADKARAQCILIFSLGSQHMIVEAMSQSLSSLKQLGEPIPSHIGFLNVMMEARKTSAKLRNVSDQDILSLPQMVDPRTLLSLNILNIVFLYNFSSRPPSAAVIAMRMVRRSLEGGLSAMSSIGFAAYGMILSNGFGDMANGARFGKLALKIYDMFALPEWFCRVNVLVWACLLPGHLPIRQCTPFMRKAGIAGLAAGDMEFAMLGVVLYTAYSIISARPLGDLYKEALDFLDRMKLHRQDLILLWHLPLLQVISTLIGDAEAENPAILTGKYMNEKEVLEDSFYRKNIASITVIYYNKLTVAVTMGDWVAAEQVCFAWEKDCDFSTIMVPVQDYTRFMMALASLVRLRSGTPGNRRRRRRAERFLAILRKRLQFSEENYSHRVSLLEAEEAMSQNRKELAIQKYHEAIEAAGEQAFWMEQGLAYERLSVCLSEKQRMLTEESIELLREAKLAYMSWGATTKVQQLTRFIDRWAIETKKINPSASRQSE